MIEIEPASERRGPFARWVLKHGDAVKQSGANTWLVPTDFYAAVPVEVLDGAYVDGFLYSAAPVRTESDEAAAQPLTSLDADLPKTNTRKARAK